MQMSKNQPGHLCGPREFGFGSFLRVANLKTVVCFCPEVLVGVAGFEPATLRLSSACSNQLSYTPMAAVRRFEI